MVKNIEISILLVSKTVGCLVDCVICARCIYFTKSGSNPNMDRFSRVENVRGKGSWRQFFARLALKVVTFGN